MIGLPCTRAKRLGEIVRPIAYRIISLGDYCVKNIDPDEHSGLCRSVLDPVRGSFPLGPSFIELNTVDRGQDVDAYVPPRSGKSDRVSQDLWVLGHAMERQRPVGLR